MFVGFAATPGLTAHTGGTTQQTGSGTVVGIPSDYFRVGGVTLEIAGPLDPLAAPAPDRFGGLAYRVADVTAARARLAAGGFDVSPTRPGFKPGTRVCSVRAGTCSVPTLLIGPAGPD